MAGWRGRGARREGASTDAASASPSSSAAAAASVVALVGGGAAGGTPVSVHVVPEGGSLAVECTGGTYISKVAFASWGTPRVRNGTVWQAVAA